MLGTLFHEIGIRKAIVCDLYLGRIQHANGLFGAQAQGGAGPAYQRRHVGRSSGRQGASFQPRQELSGAGALGLGTATACASEKNRSGPTLSLSEPSRPPRIPLKIPETTPFQSPEGHRLCLSPPWTPACSRDIPGELFNSSTPGHLRTPCEYLWRFLTGPPRHNPRDRKSVV